METGVRSTTLASPPGLETWNSFSVDEPLKVHSTGSGEAAEAGRFPHKVFPLLGSPLENNIWGSGDTGVEGKEGLGFVGGIWKNNADGVVEEEEEGEEEEETNAIDAVSVEKQASLDSTSSALAWENWRLMQENVMLRMQSEQWHQSNLWWPMVPMEHWGVVASEPEPGAMVWFHGLEKAQELNGQYGVVSRWHADSGRWVVQMPNGEEKIAKAENLMVVQSQPQLGCYPVVFPEPATKAGRRRSKKSSVVSVAGAGTGKARPHSSSIGSDSTTTGSQRSASTGLEDWPEPEPEHVDADTAEVSPPPSQPRVAKLGKAATTPRCDAERTTVMMRNIPNNYTRDMLLELLNAQGFAGCYDLVYLPIDFQTEVGLGYTFINLTSPDDAERFRRHFQGFTGWRVVTEKVCEVSWSDALQGVEAHVDRYRNSPVMHESVPDEFKPALYNKDGKREPFPAPTKTIRPPRLRKFAPK